jgi:hypothetical protein
MPSTRRETPTLHIAAVMVNYAATALRPWTRANAEPGLHL